MIMISDIWGAGISVSHFCKMRTSRGHLGTWRLWYVRGNYCMCLLGNPRKHEVHALMFIDTMRALAQNAWRWPVVTFLLRAYIPSAGVMAFSPVALPTSG